jgi:hypothetical protein
MHQEHIALNRCGTGIGADIDADRLLPQIPYPKQASIGGRAVLRHKIAQNIAQVGKGFVVSPLVHNASPGQFD